MIYCYLAYLPAGEDPGFLEGVQMHKGVGFALLIYLNFLQYPMKMK